MKNIYLYNNVHKYIHHPPPSSCRPGPLLGVSPLSGRIGVNDATFVGPVQAGGQSLLPEVGVGAAPKPPTMRHVCSIVHALHLRATGGSSQEVMWLETWACLSSAGFSFLREMVQIFDAIMQTCAPQATGGSFLSSKIQAKVRNQGEVLKTTWCKMGQNSFNMGDASYAGRVGVHYLHLRGGGGVWRVKKFKKIKIMEHAGKCQVKCCIFGRKSTGVSYARGRTCAPRRPLEPAGHCGSSKTISFESCLKGKSKE